MSDFQAWQQNFGERTVHIDSTISQHMGDVFILIEDDEAGRGVFLTEAQWDEIDQAARAAIADRKQRTAEGWT